jgi:hypothetical protein
MNFTSWLSSTLELQVKSYGQDPGELTGPELMEFIRWNVLAATDELHEALQETGWKPWATSSHLNRDEFIGEMVDALHFIANLLCAAKCSGEELGQRYIAKQRRNAERQEVGYTGLEKCPTCRRAFDDIDEARSTQRPLDRVMPAGTRYILNGIKYCGETCARAGADC